MQQDQKPNTTILSRRAALTGLAGATAAGAVVSAAAATGALCGIDPALAADPIFAAIEDHKRLIADTEVARLAYNAVEATRPSDCWKGERGEQWEAASGFDEAEDAWEGSMGDLNDGAEDFMNVTPTTMPGVIALLRYLEDFGDRPDDVWELPEDWANTALQTVRDSLSELTPAKGVTDGQG
jgi:hypothetical protein